MLSDSARRRDARKHAHKNAAARHFGQRCRLHCPRKKRGYLFLRCWLRQTERCAGEIRQPLCKFVAAGKRQPALLHIEIILDRICAQGGFSPPLALLSMAETFADFFAEVLHFGHSAATALRSYSCASPLNCPRQV